MSTTVLLLMLLAGVGIVAYPTFSDWWNSYHQTRAIAGYVEAVKAADPNRLQALLKEAEAYNKRLLTDPNRYSMSEEERLEYESLLDLAGTGVMGYVQIPKIGISYPVYHGTEERVLQIAIGHIEGTSLPVGGISTHAALSGHRGLPSAKLFTDIDQLVEGDRFQVTVLGRTLVYQVDQIHIVDPADMRDLVVAQGQDQMTLITCTPYGVNSHRLLVRGHRVSEEKEAAIITAEAVQVPSFITVPAVAVPLLTVYLAGVLVLGRGQGRRASQDIVKGMRERINAEEKV